MKTALAIVCSLLLAWTNIVLAQAPEAGVACRAHCCCHDCGKSCCAAHHSLPGPQPVSAAPVSAFQTHFAPLATTIVAWTLPQPTAREFSSSPYPSETTAGTALFTRDCAWLIGVFSSDARSVYRKVALRLRMIFLHKSTVKGWAFVRLCHQRPKH